MQGTDDKGKVYPRCYITGLCINALIDEYVRAFPSVVRVRMDVAIDQTHVLIGGSDGLH
jgi:hypothetical protein